VVVGGHRIYQACHLRPAHLWLDFEPDPTTGSYEALILSVNSFHRCSFFQQVKSLGDQVAILAAIETASGLLIEVSFVSTFTQRFFGVE
jgi:hypothetical protein